VFTIVKSNEITHFNQNFVHIIFKVSKIMMIDFKEFKNMLRENKTILMNKEKCIFNDL
jgi:hypothetical protein